MNRQINVSIQDVTGKSWQFEKLRTLLSFLENEANYWKKQHESVNASENVRQVKIHNYIASHSGIEHAINDIKQWSKNDSWDDRTFERQIVNSLVQVGQGWLWSGHPYSSVFVQCNKQFGKDTATAFFAYVVNNDLQNIHAKDWFSGIMLGYEFLHQDSDIVKRRKAEKISLGHLRNQLEQTNNSLIDEVENFKSDFNTWDAETRQKWENFLGQSSEQHSDQQKKHGDEFASYMEDCKTKIQELEKTYQEKLRMEKPANYWKQAARKFRWNGIFWSFLLIGSLAIGLYYLIGFYTDWLKGQEIKVQLDTVSGIVIFGTVLAVYAFLVRTFSRLTFSTFHLMRDAEEREQLTYLYLSLINEGNIDEKSRNIILQSLFSRSETGLLAGDSGPTMPSFVEMTTPNKQQ